MAISTSPIPTTPAELDAIKRRLQDPTIDITKLQQYATGSVATIPGYLALGELSRRNSLIQNQQAQSANPAPPTILQQQAQQAQAPQQGIAQGMPQGMPPGAPPPQGGQMPPQAPPQPPQMPPKPVAAANGGLMHLPMRPDMFRRSDYAHGGVVHFQTGGASADVARVGAELDTLNSTVATMEKAMGSGGSRNPINPELKANYDNAVSLRNAKKAEYDELMRKTGVDRASFTPQSSLNPVRPVPNPVVKETVQTGNALNPPTTTNPVVKDPNAGIEPLNNISSGGGGESGGGGINKDTAALADPAIQYINKYLKSADLPRITKGDYLEGKREQGLDVLPRTSTSRIEEILQSYNKPRTWQEDLVLMKQDALKARPGAGFSGTDVGGTARALDASNREKSIALSLKLEEIENLDRKAQFAHRNGQDDEATKIENKRDELIAEVQKVKGTVAGQAVQGIASLAKMPKPAGITGTGVGAETILKIKEKVYDFINNPDPRSPYWEYVEDPTGNIEKTLTDKSMKGTNSYNNALKELQKQAKQMQKRALEEVGTGRAVVYPKTRPAG